MLILILYVVSILVTNSNCYHSLIVTNINCYHVVIAPGRPRGTQNCTNNDNIVLLY